MISSNPKAAETFVGHGPCEKCGSSDGVGWYADGHGFCFVCNNPHRSIEHKKERQRMESRTRSISPVTDVFHPLHSRGLDQKAIEKYRIDINLDKNVDVDHRYPYFKNGIHIANKIRIRSEKTFLWEGNPSDVELFGQHLFPAGCANAITLVEGELDAPSAWQLLGSRYPVVSVTSANSAHRDVRRNYEYLNSFDDIVICFDKDDAKVRNDGTVFYPGQEAAKKVAELFAPGKCRILELQRGKDPNDYLVKGIDPKEFSREWWRAKKFTPDGLISGTDLWDKIINRPQHFSIPYPFEGLTRLTYGIRLSEFTVINAPPGVGKTSLMKEIEYAILTHPDVVEKGYGVGFLHFEETDADLGLGLMSVHNSKPYHLPDTPQTEEELRKAYDEIINTPRVVVYDHFGSNEIDTVLAKVRHMAALGCKYIVLDHLSIIVSDQAGDERKQLDEISTKLKTFCMEADIALVAVIHQNRQGQIRGTAGVEQLANIVLRLERDLTCSDPWRRNVTKVIVEKNRFCGRTGPACWLFYDEHTGRMQELNAEEIDAYEQGQSLRDDQHPF